MYFICKLYFSYLIEKKDSYCLYTHICKKKINSKKIGYSKKSPNRGEGAIKEVN